MNQVSFASDNYAGIHADVLQAISAVNHGHVPAYGSDTYTEQAIKLFQHHFGHDIDVHFVLNGTSANVLGLATLIKSHEAIICSEKAHIQVDECGAPEKFIGAKLLLVPAEQGKISILNIEKYLRRLDDQHAVQPKVISISQSTEYGTVYSFDEIKQLADYAHQKNMYLHMDGARICNAAVSLNASLQQITRAAGVDVLSFGGTKNGMMLGEAVVFFHPELAKQFKYIRKQGMQLASKMRFIAAQFQAMLSNDLWKRNAQHANKMAAYLAEKLAQIPTVKLTQPVQANAIFAIMPKDLITKLQQHYPFYVWDETISEVRLMTAFDTKVEDIERFITLAESFTN